MFYVDEKIVTWRRNYIDAETEEEAINMVKTNEWYYNITDSEVLYEAEEEYPLEYDGNPTIELYNDSDKLIYDNRHE